MLAVFCISVHSRCIDRLFHTRLVAVLRVRSSAISWEYWVRESCICWKFRWMALICSMDTVLKHTAYFRLPAPSNRGMPTVITLVWVWLMVWVVVIFFLVRMISAVMQGEKVPSASRSKADLPTMEPWAKPKFFSYVSLTCNMVPLASDSIMSSASTRLFWGLRISNRSFRLMSSGNSREILDCGIKRPPFLFIFDYTLFVNE